MTPIFHSTSEKKKFGEVLFASLLLSCLSVIILFLEYGLFNFGDSDLPPYQSDTLFERSFDLVWFTVSIGAVVGWVYFITYVSVLLFGFIKRRLA